MRKPTLRIVGEKMANIIKVERNKFDAALGRLLHAGSLPAAKIKTTPTRKPAKVIGPKIAKTR